MSSTQLTSDQAIILSPVVGIPTSDCIQAVGDKVGPKNLLYASRLNNTVCIYLSRPGLVDFLIEKHILIIQGQQVQIKRYVQTLVISNVHPTIPEDVIVDELYRLGLTPLSRITHLPLRMSETSYEHILSFRIVIDISPTEDVPQHTTVYHGNHAYRLMFHVDEDLCTKCLQPIHQKHDCLYN